MWKYESAHYLPLVLEFIFMFCSINLYQERWFLGGNHYNLYLNFFSSSYTNNVCGMWVANIQISQAFAQKFELGMHIIRLKSPKGPNCCLLIIIICNTYPLNSRIMKLYFVAVTNMWTEILPVESLVTRHACRVRLGEAGWGWVRLGEVGWDRVRLGEAGWGQMSLCKAGWGWVRLRIN